MLPIFLFFGQLGHSIFFRSHSLPHLRLVSFNTLLPSSLSRHIFPSFLSCLTSMSPSRLASANNTLNAFNFNRLSNARLLNSPPHSSSSSSNSNLDREHSLFCLNSPLSSTPQRYSLIKQFYSPLPTSCQAPIPSQAQNEPQKSPELPGLWINCVFFQSVI